MSGQRIVYGPRDMPDVEVLVDDRWWPGGVRSATEREDGTWTHHVQCRTPAGRFVGNFLDEQVRSDLVDRRRGRGVAQQRPAPLH